VAAPANGHKKRWYTTIRNQKENGLLLQHFHNNDILHKHFPYKEHPSGLHTLLQKYNLRTASARILPVFHSDLFFHIRYLLSLLLLPDQTILHIRFLSHCLPKDTPLHYHTSIPQWYLDLQMQLPQSCAHALLAFSYLCGQILPIHKPLSVL